MSTHQDIDVLVVGLGPAGARAAAAAARAGMSVRAIDRRARPGHPVQCAEFVPTMLDQELSGLASLTHQKIGSMLTFIEDGPADLRLDFPGRMIDRRAFDESLVCDARDAGASCEFGVGLAGIGPHGRARLNNGNTVGARVVIGADGPRSAVGRAVGQSNAALVETRQITVEMTRPHDATDIFLSADIRGGYAWLFPKGPYANLGVGVAPCDRANLKPLLERLHRRLFDEGRVGIEIVGHTGGAIPVGGMISPAARLGETQVLLAGDAAGLANPVTGAGIASAAISGALAGEAAAAFLAGEDDALAAYAEELEDLFGPALRRALTRRHELLAAFDSGERPSSPALKRGWIAYPEYWAA
jgi:geranylgeranyl reductase family protein